MPTLNYVGGEKGGCGKSFLVRALMQYHLDRQLPFIGFDTDRSNPDCKRCYDSACDIKLAVLSEAERLEDSANILFNNALEHDVLCNLPAQVAPALKSWIYNNQLLELAAETGVQFRMFFVSDAGYESLKLLERSLKLFGAHIPHVLVQNRGMTDDWSPVEEDSRLQQLLVDYSVVVMNFPRFIGNADRNFIDRHSLTFGEALYHPDLGPISRQRVKTFLKKAYAEFDRTNLFGAKQTKKKTSKRHSRGQ